MNIKFDLSNFFKGGKFDPSCREVYDDIKEITFVICKQIEFDYDFKFNEYFVDFDDSCNSICTIRFINSDEMNKLSKKIDYRTRDRCIHEIQDFLDKTKDRFTYRDTVISSICSSLVKLIECLELDKNLQNKDSQYKIKKVLDELKEHISSVKDSVSFEGRYSKKIFVRETESILDKVSMLQFPDNLFSSYHEKYNNEENLVFICLENIKEECKKNPEFDHYDYIALVCSFIVHEYTRFLCEITKQEKNIIVDEYEKIQYQALQDTIAEAVQLLYIKQLNSPNIKDWLITHCTSGVFPGYGYAGAYWIGENSEIYVSDKDLSDRKDGEKKPRKSLLEKFKEAEEKGFANVFPKPRYIGGRIFENILFKVIQLSRTNWRAAYIFLYSMMYIKDIYDGENPDKKIVRLRKV